MGRANETFPKAALLGRRRRLGFSSKLLLPPKPCAVPGTGWAREIFVGLNYSCNTAEAPLMNRESWKGQGRLPTGSEWPEG